jgi:uncharacterized protein YjiS (DUF1127 family)
MTPNLLTSQQGAAARRPAADAAALAPAHLQATRTSANAAVFAAGPTAADGAEVIEAWARQASFASGFGGGLAEVDTAPAAPAAERSRAAPALLQRALRDLTQRIQAWLAEQRTVMRARQTARELAELDEHQLRDIGLSRSELLSAAFECERATARSTARIQT